MTDEDREALADMLVRCGIERGVLGRIDADNVARILQPVVDAIARRRAAAELRTAAKDVDDGEFSNRWSAAARATILARADALTRHEEAL